MEVLARFHKSTFSPLGIREYANELNYTSKITSFLRGELDLRSREPSEALVRWILNSDGMYEGRVMSSVIDRFKPIVQNALQHVLRDVVRRSVAALDKGMTGPEAPNNDSSSDVGDVGLSTIVAAETVGGGMSESVGTDSSGASRIVTTARELSAYSIIQAQFSASPTAKSTIFDSSTRRETPIELGFKDTTGYFCIYFNKPTWWVARLYTEGSTPWIGLNLDPANLAALLPPGFQILPPHAFAESRVALADVNSLHSLGLAMNAAFQKTVEDRKGRS